MGHRNEVALHAISTFNELAAFRDAADSGDALRLFALRPGRAQQLIAGLQADARPSLDDLLKGGDMFAGVFIDNDLNGPDTIVIRFRDNLESALAAIASNYEAAVRDYELTIPTIATMAAALAAMGRLSRGQLQEGVR